MDPQTYPGDHNAHKVDALSYLLSVMEADAKNDEFIENINARQRNLLHDVRVQHQWDWFQQALQYDPPKYYSEMAEIGLHILRHGKAAQSSRLPAVADFLVFDCREWQHWLQTGTGDKIVVLQDWDWFCTRPEVFGSLLLKQFRSRHPQTLKIDVQDYDLVHQGPGTTFVVSKDIDAAIDRFEKDCKRRCPVNLLNLSSKEDGLVPWPLSKHCTMLNEAAAVAVNVAQAKYKGVAGPGKEFSETMTKAIDLQSCMHFQILGQAGAISGWHMDHIGPYTWVTLEPNLPQDLAYPDNVLKLWAVVRTDSLSSEEETKVRQKFRREGQHFVPPPDLIRIIALTAGDTLIMPPGTIHAPITITDCLFRGGMAIQERNLRRHIKAWRFCVENDRCTNEDVPKQSRSVIDFFRTRVQQDPAGCGYLGKNGFKEFEEDWRLISGRSLKCGCQDGCKRKNCACRVSAQRCGNKCHAGGGEKCDNPLGCEATID
jgi:hypothetical protein